MTAIDEFINNLPRGGILGGDTYGRLRTLALAIQADLTALREELAPSIVYENRDFTEAEEEPDRKPEISGLPASLPVLKEELRKLFYRDKTAYDFVNISVNNGDGHVIYMDDVIETCSSYFKKRVEAELRDFRPEDKIKTTYGADGLLASEVYAALDRAFKVEENLDDN